MAKHIPFGSAVNDSELWAFNFLEERLPDHYQILTNVELTTNNRDTNEVDAIVLGDYAVYLVDVKGYVGHLEAGKDVWQLDGRPIENSLSKASWLARVLAERMRKAARRRMNTPWCQGLIFVTGREGREASISFPHDPVDVYSSVDIISALTTKERCSSPGGYRIDKAQIRLAKDVIGQVRLVEQRNAHLGDFRKENRLVAESGFEVWTALYEQPGWSSKWLLKIVTPAAIEICPSVCRWAALSAILIQST